MTPAGGRRAPIRVCLVGSGTRFVSGISYYTYHLARELDGRTDLSVVLLRRLIPRCFYPGRSRVGAAITPLQTAGFCPTFDGIDWYGFPSVLRALAFLRRHRPQVLVLQWWTVAALPWYLLLAAWARRSGTRVVLELHEDLDSGEARLPLVARVAARGFRSLVRRVDRFVVHSEWDRRRMSEQSGLPPGRTHVIGHGPYPMGVGAGAAPAVEAGAGVTTILFFGTIRPYKGLEHLVAAFERLPRQAGEGWRLLVVGETWEGWTGPLEMIGRSPYSADIVVVNRYVTDQEVPSFFEAADIVALPYLRSSASGPLHLTMTAGLPVVVTAVGGLEEAARGYSGAVLVEPANPDDLARGLLAARELAGTSHADPVSWHRIGDRYERVIQACIGGEDPPTAPRPAPEAGLVGGRP